MDGLQGRGETVHNGGDVEPDVIIGTAAERLDRLCTLAFKMRFDDLATRVAGKAAGGSGLSISCRWAASPVSQLPTGSFANCVLNLRFCVSSTLESSIVAFHARSESG